MTELLQPKKLDAQFEYEIEKNGEKYIAGAKNCYLNLGMAVYEELFLDKLNQKDSHVWAPRLTNLFSKKTITKKTRNSKLQIPSIMIAHSSFNRKSSLDNFVKFVERGILQEYQAKMSKEDMVHFFKKVHKHHMDYF